MPVHIWFLDTPADDLLSLNM